MASQTRDPPKRISSVQFTFFSKIFRKSACTTADSTHVSLSSPQLLDSSKENSVLEPPERDESSDDECMSISNATVPGRRQGIDKSDAASGRCRISPEFFLPVCEVQALRRSQSLDGVHPHQIGGLTSEARISTGSASTDGLMSGDKLLTYFRHIQHHWRGSHCELLKAVSTQTSQSVIIKSFNRSMMTESMRDKRNREVEIIQAAADVPNVMRFVMTLDCPDKVCTVVERCQGVSLIELMANSGGHISEDVCRMLVAIPLLQAVSGLHALGLVHRHLKPEHLICNGSSLTVVDFLDAADKNQHCLNSRVGHLNYMAPEVLMKPRAEDIFHQVLFLGMAEEDLPQYDERADVFSIGVLLFEALTGLQPFAAETAREMLNVQREKLKTTDGGVPSFIAQHQLSKDAEDFLVQALQEQPAKRPSAAQLLQHSWLTTEGSSNRG